MALTRILPIARVRISERDLEKILREISGLYRKTPEKLFPKNQFKLTIDQDDHTQSSYDQPPKDYESIKQFPIKRLRLRVILYAEGKEREVVLYLEPGDNEYLNRIELAGEEDWVNANYQGLSSVIKTFSPQFRVSTNVEILSVVLIAPIIGWMIMKVAFILPIWPLISETSSDRTASTIKVSSVLVYFLAYLTTLFTGAHPLLWLISFIRKSFPLVELQVGPPQFRTAEIKRKWLGGILAVAVVAPLGNLLYDIYKFVA